MPAGGPADRDDDRSPGSTSGPGGRGEEATRADDGVADAAATTPEQSTRSAQRPAPEPGAAAREDPRPSGWLGFAYDLVTSVIAVGLVGFFLFTVSGVWPPMVAVQSDSMDPHMQKGDLVFVMEEERFAGPNAVGDTGVVTAERGASNDFAKFGGPGDVIVYEKNGQSDVTPIIHRAMFYVEEGENWVDRADPAYLDHEMCETDDDPDTDTGVPNCPAPYDGFITKGDANGGYDQVGGISDVVKSEWVIGTAELRVPKLGWIRLRAS